MVRISLTFVVHTGSLSGWFSSVTPDLFVFYVVQELLALRRTLTELALLLQKSGTYVPFY